MATSWAWCLMLSPIEAPSWYGPGWDEQGIELGFQPDLL